ncbi:MAG: hypothetical protein MJ113_02545 [Lachnospiraceae bacterium]|nr:hypothetical protein [Lachnospiraceae bacterium]
MANVFDQNNKKNRFVIALLGFSGPEMFLFVLLLVKSIASLFLIMYGNADNQRLFIFYILSEMIFSAYIFIRTIRLRKVKALLGLIFSLGTAAFYCQCCYVISLYKDYLLNTNFRLSIAVLAVILALLTAGFSIAMAYNGFCQLLLAKNPVPKRRYSFTISAMLMFISTFAMFYFPNNLLKVLDLTVIEGSSYQLNGDFVDRYEGPVNIKKQGDSAVLTKNGQTVNLKATPLYYDDGNGMVLTKTFAIIRPNLYLNHKIDSLTKVFARDDTYFVEKEGKEIEVYDFFLFDGKNTYIFFDETTITIGDNVLTLPSFTYIEAVHNRNLRIFEPVSKTISDYDISNTKVIVRMRDNTLVNVALDTITRTNRQEQMLFIQPSLLEDIK